MAGGPLFCGNFADQQGGGKGSFCRSGRVLRLVGWLLRAASRAGAVGRGRLAKGGCIAIRGIFIAIKGIDQSSPPANRAALSRLRARGKSGRHHWNRVAFLHLPARAAVIVPRAGKQQGFQWCCCRVPCSAGISGPMRPGRAIAVAIAPENGPPRSGKLVALNRKSAAERPSRPRRAPPRPGPAGGQSPPLRGHLPILFKTVR